MNHRLCRPRGPGSAAAGLRRLGGLLIALVLLAGLAPSGQGRAEGVRHDQGLLWRVTREGTPPSHLFGTMHSTDQAVVTLPAPVAEAFGRAGSLTLELVMTPELARRTGLAMLLGDGRSLDRILGPELFARVARAGTRYGIAAEMLRLLKPWAVVTILSYPPDEYARQVAGTPFLDQLLQERALARGIPVYALETFAEQIAALESLPEADILTFLDALAVPEPEVEALFGEMLRRYLARDIGGLLELLQQQMAGQDRQLMVAFEEHMIRSRNHRMAERMVERLEEGNAFIAVGALHLPGDEGVLHLLKRRGFQVTPVY